MKSLDKDMEKEIELNSGTQLEIQDLYKQMSDRRNEGVRSDGYSF